MNAHEERIKDEEIVGEILDMMQPQAVRAAAAWLAEKKDIADLLFVIKVLPDRGRLATLSRAEFCKDSRTSVDAGLRRAGVELRGGPAGRIPAVLIFDGTPLVHVAWIQPIAASELH